MSTPNSNNRSPASKLDPEKYARLKAELDAPYRGFRQFVYVAFGASGLIGALIFFVRIIAGQDIGSAIPNLALQVGVVALMVWLFRLEQKAGDRHSNAKQNRSS